MPCVKQDILQRKTVYTFVMCAHFPDVRMYTSFDVALWIICYFLFTRLLIIAHNIPHNSSSTSGEAVADTDTFAYN